MNDLDENTNRTKEVFYSGVNYSIAGFFFSSILKLVFFITQIIYKFVNTKETIIYLKNYKLKEITFHNNNSMYKKTIFEDNSKDIADDFTTENEYLLLLIRFKNEKNEESEIDITRYLNIINFHKLEPFVKKEITKEYLKLKNIKIDTDEFEVYGIKNGLNINLQKLF